MIARGLFALAGLAAFATACLPAGDPPRGRQLMTGRDTALYGVFPVRPDDPTLRFLVLRSDEDAWDLYLVSVADGDATPSEQLLVENWAIAFCGAASCVPMDSRGRLYGFSNPDIERGTQDVTRIDPITGERRELGRASGLELSRGGHRVALSRLEPVETIDIVEADDSISTLPEHSVGLFVDEDYFFQHGDAAHTLWKAPPAAAPAAVATDVISFSVIRPPGGPLLMTIPASGDAASGGGLIRFLDPVTSEERLPPIAVNRLITLSPDADWALLYNADRSGPENVALLQTATGAEEPFELPPSFGEARWRPGHDEVWIQQPRAAQEPGPTLIKRPGQPLETTPVAVADDTTGLVSWFTRDGDHWFSRERSQEGKSWNVLVGNADDPAAPRFPLNPDGTEIWLFAQRSDGRILIQATYASAYRHDIILIDPTDGASRLLGKDGYLLAWGARRVVANLRFTNESGDLTVIDIDSGQATVLAAEFAQDAVVEPPGTGGLWAEPGARLLFHFRARFASPYDGIWLTTLP